MEPDRLYLYIPILMCVQVLKLIGNAYVVEHDTLYLYIPILMCVQVLKLTESVHVEHDALPVHTCIDVLTGVEVDRECSHGA